MSFSYSGNPASSNKDAVRFLIKDTTSASAQATDEEINWVVSQEANIYMAAALIMETIARRVDGLTSKKTGDLTLTWGNTSNMLQQASNLRARGQGSYQELYAGGISKADKLSHEQDTDVPKPSFKRDRMDNPETTIEDEESSA